MCKVSIFARIYVCYFRYFCYFFLPIFEIPFIYTKPIAINAAFIILRLYNCVSSLSLPLFFNSKILRSNNLYYYIIHLSQACMTVFSGGGNI